MKPLLCFDIESTGTDPASDRIVQIAFQVAGTQDATEFLVNPGQPIPPGATEIHGISDEDVSDAASFQSIAADIHDLFRKCDLLGFNLVNFDVPILWEEFHRAGIEWDLANTRVLDAGTLFKKREERTLSAAMQFYCNREIDNAHNAVADVAATIDVWFAQLRRYQLEEASREQLETESNYETVRVDLAGKIVIGDDGRPAYNIGKAKGTAVLDDPGFGYWMLERDFSANTKMHLRRILQPEVASVGTDEPF